MKISSKLHRQQTDAAIRRGYQRSWGNQSAQVEGEQGPSKGVKQLRAERFAAIEANSLTRDQLLSLDPSEVWDGRHEWWLTVRTLNVKSVSVVDPLAPSYTKRIPYTRITSAR